MSASNMLNKTSINSGQILPLALAIIFIAFFAFSLMACQKGEKTLRYNIVVVEEKEKANINNESDIINIPENNQTPFAEFISTEQSEEQETKENETKEQGQIPEVMPARANMVEFYFLLKGKAYFKYLLKEEEQKSFNMSGTIIRIIPVFIANDSVIFKVDEYTTRSIGEKQWFYTPGFEIYVKDIYFRG